MKRYLVPYLATLVALMVARCRVARSPRWAFVGQVGDLLGEVRALPAILFYIDFVGVLIFVNARPLARSQLPMCWGAAVTAISSTAGLAIANWLAPQS